MEVSGSAHAAKQAIIRSKCAFLHLVVYEPAMVQKANMTIYVHPVSSECQDIKACANKIDPRSAEQSDQSIFDCFL